MRCGQGIASRAEATQGSSSPPLGSVVTRPTRELVLRVEWPLGFRPADVKALAAPAAVPFADDLPTISTGSVKVSWRDSCASLTVKEPVVGVRYGLVWCLP